jgi:hypothetical protein
MELCRKTDSCADDFAMRNNQVINVRQVLVAPIFEHAASLVPACAVQDVVALRSGPQATVGDRAESVFG